jgi:hypothetical protein
MFLYIFLNAFLKAFRLRSVEKKIWIFKTIGIEAKLFLKRKKNKRLLDLYFQNVLESSRILKGMNVSGDFYYFNLNCHFQRMYHSPDDVMFFLSHFSVSHRNSLLTQNCLFSKLMRVYAITLTNTFPLFLFLYITFSLIMKIY